MNFTDIPSSPKPIIEVIDKYFAQGGMQGSTNSVSGKIPHELYNWSTNSGPFPLKTVNNRPSQLSFQMIWACEMQTLAKNSTVPNRLST